MLLTRGAAHPHPQCEELFLCAEAHAERKGHRKKKGLGVRLSNVKMNCIMQPSDLLLPIIVFPLLLTANYFMHHGTYDFLQDKDCEATSIAHLMQ